MTGPDYQTLKSRFEVELRGNTSLSYRNSDVGTAWAFARAAIHLLAEQRFDYNRALGMHSIDAGIYTFLLDRYGYITAPHINGGPTISQMEAWFPTIADWETTS